MSENITKQRLEQEELLAVLTELEKRKKTNRISFEYQDKGPLNRHMYPKHLEFIGATKDHSECIFMAGNRPLSDTTLVCMADGTKKLLSDIAIGDRILGYSIATGISSPTTVIAIPYKGCEEVFRLSTARDKFVDATADHEFPLFQRSGSTTIVRKALKDISADFSISHRLGLITPKCIDYHQSPELPLTPYVLGALLGDGCIKYSGKTFTNIDESVLDRFQDEIGFKFGNRNIISYSIAQGQHHPLGKGWFNRILESLGLYDKTHIPLIYKTASIDDRKNLLAGLIDTDGTATEFVNKHEQLVKDFCEVVISLGGYAKYKSCLKKCCNTGAIGTYYRAYFRLNIELPVSLGYKQQLLTKRACNYQRNPIDSKISLGHMPVTCITVDNDDHCFLVNDFIATFNCGKTFVGSRLISWHATGLYPEWFTGRRFTKPVAIWVAGKTGQSTRDICQKELLGERTEIGSGSIPKDCIVDIKSKPGIPDGIETATVKHVSGGSSVITFKTYDAGVSSFVGVALDICWLDELPENPAIYLECQVRLMTRKGLCLVTATPDRGMSPTILAFFPDGKISWGELPGGHKWVTNMVWDETPHLDESEKERLLSGMSPHEKMAKTLGIPYLGAGQIFPLPENEYTCKPFEIPRSFLKTCGLDVGWNVTSAVFMAIDPVTRICYIYSVYYRGQAEPAVHAQGIGARGKWIPIAVDPAARGRSQVDGQQLIQMYADLGLDIFKANNEVESGLLTVLDMLSAGKIKIFEGICEPLLAEMRLYRRDDGGRVLKKNDHACDALRYCVMSGIDAAIREPREMDDETASYINGAPDKTTGY